jgi:hypothetical protein
VVTLIAADSKASKTSLLQERMREWNSVVRAQLMELRDERVPRPGVAQRVEVDLARDALCTSRGALLPLPRARDFIKATVYHVELRLSDAHDMRRQLESATADGTDFKRSGVNSDGEKYFCFEEHDHLECHAPKGQAKMFSCSIHLPPLALCSAHVGSKLPHRVQLVDPLTGLVQTFPSKIDAEDRVALAACTYLHSIGVLDDELNVVGRDEALERVRERAHKPARGSRKANAHELALKELVVRRLPSCFEPPSALRDATPSVDDGTSLQLHVYQIVLDGVPSGRGVMLSRPCRLDAPFQLGADGKQRHTCQLSALPRVTLSILQLRQLAECHVAELDLVQAGNAHEPLHPVFARVLRAPAQLLAWDNEMGTYQHERLDATEGRTVPREQSTPTCTLLGSDWASLSVAAQSDRSARRDQASPSRAPTLRR